MLDRSLIISSRPEGNEGGGKEKIEKVEDPMFSDLFIKDTNILQV